MQTCLMDKKKFVLGCSLLHRHSQHPLCSHDQKKTLFSLVSHGSMRCSVVPIIHSQSRKWPHMFDRQSWSWFLLTSIPAFESRALGLVTCLEPPLAAPIGCLLLFACTEHFVLVAPLILSIVQAWSEESCSAHHWCGLLVWVDDNPDN